MFQQPCGWYCSDVELSSTCLVPLWWSNPPRTVWLVLLSCGRFNRRLVPLWWSHVSATMWLVLL
jgi:hypothetical protein